MSAEAGRIFPSFTHVEIDEKGQIWLIQNHFESDSVIIEMESTSKGRVIYGYDDGVYHTDVYDDDDDIDFGEDYL